MASPYPSFLPPLASAVLALAQPQPQQPQQPRVSVLTAAPACHGFAQASGFKGLVPAMHAHLLQSALAQSPAPRVPRAPLNGTGRGGAGQGAGQGGAVSTTLYARPGWTFHAKGLWLWLRPSSPRAREKGREGLEGGDGDESVVSYIGSSNLGARSWHRDFELGFVLAAGRGKAGAEGVAGLLARECEALEEHAGAGQAEPPARAGVLVAALARLCRSML